MATGKDSTKSKKYFDGTTDIEAFITITELNAAIKGYTEEKKAQYFASLLVEGPALNVYLRLTADEKKDAEAIKMALKTEFEAAHRDREVALVKLTKRNMEKGESPQTYAYALLQLTKLAYSTLPEPSQEVIAKDRFIQGQSKEMQTALKSWPNFSTKTLSQLAQQTVVFQTAGVSVSNGSVSVKSEVNEVSDLVAGSNVSLVDEIVEKVVSKLQFPDAEDPVNFVQSSDRGNRGNRGNRGKGRFNRRGYRESSAGRGAFSCRNCRSPSHGYSKCPTRFCQACGSRGHDAWSTDCPNYR